MATIDLMESKKIESLYLGDDVKGLLSYVNAKDFFLKHKSLYLLKKKKEQGTVPFLLPIVLDVGSLEEDRLRILDGFSELEGFDIELLKPLLYDKNPYINRGMIVFLANMSSEGALAMLLLFAASPKGRIIKRDLFGEAIGLMLKRNPGLILSLEEWMKGNDNVRGYLAGMDFKPPKNGQLSIYPAHDYWTLLSKASGYDYVAFKYHLQSLEGKKF